MTSEPQKSKGHVTFLGRFEYFKISNDDLYRAPKDKPVDINGYRMGARFESAAWLADRWLATLKKALKNNDCF